MRLVAAVLILVACKSAPPSADCDAVGLAFDRVTETLLPSAHQEMKRPQSEVDERDARFRATRDPERAHFVARCRENEWGADARNCMRGVQDQVAFEACLARVGR